INENGAQRMGKTVDQLIGTDVFSYLPIDLAASRRKKLDTVFAAAEPAIFEDQREGMYFTNAIYPIINMNGQVSSVAVYARDITARVLAEEKILASLHEKEFLLKEIHHRVKNNLQIISSLIHLQSKKITDEQTLTILKESQNRVKSMALIHEKLYQSSDFTQIDFADYIRSLAGHLFRTYQVNSNDISYEIFAEDVSLTIDLAIPCGVIINELVSNTLKHAFPGDMGGKITISLREASPNTLQLEITDTGVGFPKDIDFRKTDSLGLQLVNNLVEQLHGDIQLDSQAGSKFIITFEKYTEK
ncbi:MAG: ATP-binding protein, partial [Anaerolineae bacterium]|nr:ATP-binding protein [Anaerolineae bacterium]